MLAQEIRRWSTCHPPARFRELLRDMDVNTQHVLVTGFELGISLSPDEGRWLSGLLENALRIATHMNTSNISVPEEQNANELDGDAEENEEVNLMAGSTRRSDGGRDDRPARRDRSRSRGDREARVDREPP